MKKIYEMPLIKMKSFENVNILTLSGGTASTHANDVVAGLLNKKHRMNQLKWRICSFFDISQHSGVTELILASLV